MPIRPVGDYQQRITNSVIHFELGLIIWRFLMAYLSQRALHKVIIPKVIRLPCKKTTRNKGAIFSNSLF